LSALTTFPLERVFVPVNGRPLSIIAFNAFGRERCRPWANSDQAFRRKIAFGLDLDLISLCEDRPARQRGLRPAAQLMIAALAARGASKHPQVKVHGPRRLR
jgi:hypothetical protein